MMTLTAKLRCVQRELAIRKSVYPARVETRKMSKQDADHEIDCMEAIVRDYKALVRSEKEETGDG